MLAYNGVSLGHLTILCEGALRHNTVCLSINMVIPKGEKVKKGFIIC